MTLARKWSESRIHASQRATFFCTSSTHLGAFATMIHVVLFALFCAYLAYFGAGGA